MENYRSNYNFNVDENVALKFTHIFFPSQNIDFIETNICTTDFLKNVNPFTRTIKLFVTILTPSIR